MMMKKSSLLLLLLVVSSALMAQRSPVGIVSVQDSVKSVQFGVISSVAADGGHGVQLHHGRHGQGLAAVRHTECLVGHAAWRAVRCH